MAGAMRKMAVYLGLVEDDGYDGRGFDPDDDFEPELDPEPERDRRRHEPRTSSGAHPAQRDERCESYIRPRSVNRPSASLRNRTTRANRARGIHHTRTSDLEKNAPVIMPKVVSEREPYRITTLHPRTYNEARTIGEHFREGTPVIMNLTEMDDTDAKRLVDFAAGLVFGLHGSIERVTQKVFLLSPANVDVTAEDKARIAEGGFFNQS